MALDKASPVPAGATSLSLVSKFIVQQLEFHRGKYASSATPIPPLFVGIQGPQGCGKSYVCSKLPSPTSPLSHLRIAAFSLDDLYLPHTSLLQLAVNNPHNGLLQGRGQPGTHDLELGLTVLSQLKAINDPPSFSTSTPPIAQEDIKIPFFDKSQFSGQGDRTPSSTWPVVSRGPVPLDVVILEGWMIGFAPVESLVELEMKYLQAKRDPEAAGKEWGFERPFFLGYGLPELIEINELLRKYGPMWEMLDCFVALKPEKLAYSFQWRLEQEHNMKAQNGGKGMTDAEVKAFITRYMPGYELFLAQGIYSKKATWHNRGLELLVGRDRGILEVNAF